MTTARTRRFKAALAAAARNPREPVWEKLWNEVAARYRRGEITDSDYDRFLQEMP